MPETARVPLWADATFHATSQRSFAINRPMFLSPEPAGRKITAGFSWLQRIGKGAFMDVWFPEAFQNELNRLRLSGTALEPEHFPSHWAAVRQFELLQEASNYKIYDLDAANLGGSLSDLTRSMRAGGYRVTVATIGSYAREESDELAILDRRLQDRISKMTHMLYLEEQSREINRAVDRVLEEEKWDYRTALPHIGLTLGAKQLFSARAQGDENPVARRHRMAGQFFDILSLLPQKHIVHDTAIGLQLPESIAENEWIYLAEGEMTLRAFNAVLGDLFTPFDTMSLGRIDGRLDAGDEIKGTVQHMRGYGDRLTMDADAFQREATRYALN